VTAPATRWHQATGVPTAIINYEPCPGSSTQFLNRKALKSFISI
jgi:hypothetical protein